ncbi:hypothetical protein [Gellertiella hungarica]|uniref:Uncharacterized protein n=1 Tax=Gellertiella hungarica TaxID=1572859 RepID=A0A7W6J931_9HYPH|nr:hypothetical protein [Gellertiella hungarica]MBB4067002.1 hypothetical protein [Gellertiella hungarica]
MSNYLLDALREQSEIAKDMAHKVAAILIAPDLTAEQASQVYRYVEKCAQDFDRFQELLEDHDLDDGFFKVVESIEDLWSNMSVAAARKIGNSSEAFFNSRSSRSCPGLMPD